MEEPEEEFAYFRVEILTYEGNKCWGEVKAPSDFTEHWALIMLNTNMQGGVGGDPAEFISIEHISTTSEYRFAEYDLT